MTGKRRIIILAALAVVSFGLSFVVSSWMGGPSAPKSVLTAQQDLSQYQQGAELATAEGTPPRRASIALAEKELADLIKEVRLRIDSCKKKEKDLEKREKRIRQAGEMLKQQAQELEALRMQLVAPLGNIREAIAELENSRIRISEEEQANIKRIAAICEKMDPASGSEMLMGMCQNKQEDDAAKILRYMSERSAGKLLSEMSNKDLAARLCEKLKVLQEEG